MEFHDRDPTWNLWNIESFEQYIDQYLVRGNFHKRVPKDVIDAFTTVEHLIAHAYYYYPMYDEALSKVLRTIEMAVRIRCKELKIETEIKTKKGKTIPIPLADLIKSITDTEPDKNLFLSLDTFRHLRNSLMHPERNSFMGGIGIPAIIRAVNSINELFAPTNFFVNRNSLLKAHRTQITPWGNKTIEVQMDDYYFIAHNIEISDVFPLENRSDVCLYIQPVPVLPDYENEKHGFSQALSLNVSNLEFNTNEITATNNSDAKRIIVSCCTDPKQIQNATKYVNYLKRFFMNPLNGRMHFIEHDKHKDIAYFQYNHYHLIQ